MYVFLPNDLLFKASENGFTFLVVLTMYPCYVNLFKYKINLKEIISNYIDTTQMLSQM